MKQHVVGGRINDVPDQEGVFVVNRSNVDVQVNDCVEPFGVVVFEAGNIAPSQRFRNCMQKFARTSADSFVLQRSDAFICLTLTDGQRLLNAARECGSFQEAYARLVQGHDKQGRRIPGEIVDLSHSPHEVKARAAIKAALIAAGMPEANIPPGLGLAALRRLHIEFEAGRHHIKLTGIVPEEPVSSDPDVPIQPIDMTSAAAKATEFQEKAVLRARIVELGGTAPSAAKVPLLREILERLEARAEAANDTSRIDQNQLTPA